VTTPRTYGGATAEERRQRRRAALLDAALDIIATDGVSAVGVKSICSTAGLNNRYFYEQFTDCDQAVMAFFDDLVLQAMGAFAAVIANTEANAELRLRACVAAAIDFVTVDPRRGRFVIESQATQQLRARRQQLVATLAELMLTGRPLLGADAPSEEDSRLIALSVISGGFELSVMWLRGDLNIDRERLIDFMTAHILSATRVRALL
jgi:AcrR family transcriptional regulator